jgi:hypothetical protein
MSFTWTSEDILCTDRYLQAFPNNYVKTDVFYNSPISWREKHVYPPPSTQKLIVSGHSDFPITEDISRRYPNSKWFSVNTQSRHVSGIPLGITNDTNESETHTIYGNIPMMLEVFQTPREIKNLVYLNFSRFSNGYFIASYEFERVPLYEMLHSKPWVTCGEPVNTFEGRKEFLKEIRNHEFVLCPRGNGVDTHRLWETLYMGSIPIVKNDIAHSGWQDLPILFINNWNEITEERLIEEKKRIESTTWNFEKLRVSYWIDRIRRSIQ